MAEETKKKRRIHLNIGLIIFMTIVIYLTAVVVRDLGREKLAVYEVGESLIDDEIKGSGVIVRKETLLTLSQDGYVNYYLKDGARVRKGGVMYTLDSSGRITSWLDELAKDKDQVTPEEKQQVFEDLKTLSETFSDDSFSDIYAVRDTIRYDLMAYSDTVISDNKKELEKKFGKNSFIEARAPKAGLISYYSDGLEGMSEKNADDSVYDQKALMKDLRTREKMEKGSPVCRLVTSQKWQLLLAVSEDEYNRLSSLKKRDINTVEVTFMKDDFTTRGTFDCMKKGDRHYAVLSFQDYVQRYINQRYLSVRLLLSETKGLKIPTSSLVEKEVYRIPARFLVWTSDSGDEGQVAVLEVDKKGEKSLRRQKVNIYQKDSDYLCISTDGLKKGDVLSTTGMTDRFNLVETVKIQGAYMVNRGYAVFKAVTIIRRNEDYCIIAPEESNLVLYDRIILNSSTIRENDVIY